MDWKTSAVKIHADLGQVEASDGLAARGSEYSHVLGLDVARCRSGAVSRCGNYSSSHVQERSAVDKTEDKMVTSGRVTMVSSASGLLVAILDHYPRIRTLRQVSTQTPCRGKTKRKTAFTTLNGTNSDRCRPCKYTIQKPAALPGMSCSSACF